MLSALGSLIIELGYLETDLFKIDFGDFYYGDQSSRNQLSRDCFWEVTISGGRLWSSILKCVVQDCEIISYLLV